jgi:hypothetical protein
LAKISTAVLVAALFLTSACSDEKSGENSEVVQVDAYLDQVKYLLQEVRSMEREIARAVPADSVAIEVIAPLISERFRPKLQQLIAQADALETTPDLVASHQLLKDYLRLRMEAFELVLAALRQQRPELFEQFGQRLAAAEATGRSLEMAVERVRQGLGQP